MSLAFASEGCGPLRTLPWRGRDARSLLERFDRGNLSEACLSWLLALRVLDYLELRDLRRWEDRDDHA